MEAIGRQRLLQLERIGGDVPFALAIVGILFVILVQLPPALMDALLILNMTLSLMILLTAASVSRPIEMSVFPSLLLLVTFFRLALNIATTRLILGNEESGQLAAGAVIRAFGNFVAGNNLFVGFTVFAIIIVVQFLVITKGSTRISEVAARFTLDAMPGKQMSIDSDLSAGHIDEETARERRKEISEEADFYGAMDGASKFVRGEAMAGLVITIVNIVGGMGVGLLYHGLELSEAANVFTRLTIGDGLVTQVPALMVAVAAALLVTKSSGSRSVAADLVRQLFWNDRMFYVAAVFLLVLIQSGLPPLGLIVGATVCVAAGFSLRGQGAADAEDEEPEMLESLEDPDLSTDDGHERARSLLQVEPLELEVGYRLVDLVDESTGGDLMARLSKVREKIALDLGLILPAVKVRDNVRFRATEYSIKLRGNGMGLWRVLPGCFFVCGQELPVEGLQGTEGKDPSTGAVGLWVDESQWSLVASAGCRVRRPEEIIPAHFDAIVRTHASEILTREEVSRLLADLSTRAPALVHELVPDTLRLGDVHKVLQNLLRERVSIRDLETILETLADHGERVRDTELLTECVRKAVSRAICGSLATSDGVLHVVMIGSELEEYLQEALVEVGGVRRWTLDPDVVETLVATVVEVLEELRRDTGIPRPVFVCSDALRAEIRKLIVVRCPDAAVLAYDEVADDFRLDVHDTVALENVG